MRLNEFYNLEEDPETAYAYARQQHNGQTRSDGSPYLNHPERVAVAVSRFADTHNLDELISAALLHDTIEDTSTTYEDLKVLFGGLIASIVKELTSDKEEIAKVGKTEYLSKKMAAMSSYALIVKLADRLDNVSDIKTAKSVSWRNKYKQETIDILEYIEKNRVLDPVHVKIISLIREKLDEISEESITETSDNKPFVGAYVVRHDNQGIPSYGKFTRYNPEKDVQEIKWEDGHNMANPYYISRISNGPAFVKGYDAFKKRETFYWAAN